MTIIRVDGGRAYSSPGGRYANPPSSFGAVALTIDSQGRPLRLRFGNDDIDASTFAHDLDVQITKNSGNEVTGRFTYFRDDAETPACRVTFDVWVQ